MKRLGLSHAQFSPACDNSGNVIPMTAHTAAPVIHEGFAERVLFHKEFYQSLHLRFPQSP
jgi:hypothetical protein